MSAHDRGTFGALLAKLEASGKRGVTFSCNLKAADNDHRRWTAWTWADDELPGVGHGRTGEEALRTLVESLSSDSPPPTRPEGA